MDDNIMNAHSGKLLNTESKKFEWLFLILLTLAAFIIRFIKLDVIPPGNWYDEAINGLDALSITDAKFPPLFFMTEGHPREPMYMYLALLVFKLLGVSYITLRLTSVIIGVVTIPAAYFFAKEYFDKRTAMLSSILLVFFRWHVHFSRLAFRTILTPLFILLVFYFLRKGFKQRKNLYFILGGIFFGLGFYTYLAFRLVVLVLAVFLIVETWKKWNKKTVKYIVVFAVAGLCALAPLLIDYVLYPEHFTGRTGEVTLFNDGFAAGAKAVLGNVKSVALMFSFKGDHVSKHNVPYMPVFDPITSILFYLGLVLSFRRIKESSYSLLILWFFILLLTTILSFGSPNILRSLAITPVCTIFATIGFLFIFDFLKKKYSPAFPIAIMVCYLLFFSSIELYRYFITWPRHKETYYGFNTNFADAARTLNEVETDRTVFIHDVIYNHPTFVFESYNHKDKYKPYFLDMKSYLISGLPEKKEFLILLPDGEGAASFLASRNFHKSARMGELRMPKDPPVWAALYRVDSK